jgi:hypothetical protein
MAAQSTRQIFTSNRWISKQRVMKIGMAGAFAVLGGLRNLRVFMHNTAGTQDAYAKADSAQIGTRVSGTVSRVLADNKMPGRTTAHGERLDDEHSFGFCRRAGMYPITRKEE